MPAYTFQGRFAELVRTGQKQQTFRSSDKGAEPGMYAYLYSDEGLLEIGTIKEVLPLELGRHSGNEPYGYLTNPNGEQTFLINNDLEAFAMLDGFNDAEELMDLAQKQYGLPFKGYLHIWELNK